jgi:MFS family permease
MSGTHWAIRGLFFVYGVGFSTWASRIPDIKAAMSLSDGELGAILFAMPVGSLTGLQFSGRVAARYGSHRVTVPGVTVYLAVLLALGLADTPWQLGLLLAAFGLCGNLASTSLQTQGVLAEKQAERPLMASFHGSWSVGGFCGGLLGLLAAQTEVGPGLHFALVAVLFICLVPLAWRHLVAMAPVVKKAASGRRFDPVLVQLGVIAFCSMGTEACMFDWSGVYFREVVDAPMQLVPLGYTAFMVTAAFGRFVGDRVVARFGRLRVLQVGGLGASLGLALSVLFPSLLPATLAFMLVGLSVSNIIPTVYSMAGKSRPEDPANALAAVAQVGFLGFLLAPPVIGGVASFLGLRASLAAVACLGLMVPWVASRASALRD